MRKTVDESDEYSKMTFESMGDMEFILIDKLYELGLVPCKESTLVIGNLYYLAQRRGAKHAAARFLAWPNNTLPVDTPFGVLGGDDAKSTRRGG